MCQLGTFQWNLPLFTPDLSGNLIRFPFSVALFGLIQIENLPAVPGNRVYIDHVVYFEEIA
jgi:hypothetical protein